jgi:hypothetical protein
MGYELKGTVLKVGETKQVGERFRKRELIIETADNPKYPQPIMMEMTGDKADQLDGVNVGDTVRVDFSIRGRAWNGNSGETKYFISLDVWRVEVTSKGAGAQTGGDFGGFGAGNGSGDIPFASCDISLEPSPIAKVLR